jgi:hypothetical protein
MSKTLSACKQRGEAAEARFLAKAIGLGLAVSRPWGENYRYDFIVEGRRKLHRVQVKSVWARRSRRWRTYWVSASRGNDSKTAYGATEIDFLVVLVSPERAWYVIPVRALAGRKAIRLGSNHPQSRGLFEKYREAWGLLG